MGVRQDSFPSVPAALIIGHPGHELRVHRWLELARPVVFVLTDGSGRTGQSRLGSTRAILDQAGASPGRLFGAITDEAAYEAILNHDFKFFIDLARELESELADTSVEYVAGDALEGYNVVHDVCRYLINAVIARLSGGLDGRSPKKREIDNFDFPLTGRPDACQENLRNRAIWLHLDETALQRKIRTAENYSAIAADVAEALETIGRGAFSTECLRPVHVNFEPPELPPYYEKYGEKQVAAGYYRRLLRYREHVEPLTRALFAYSRDLTS
jgi:hypothetical protein